MSDKVTVTARMELAGEGVRALERWIGHAIDRVHGRVNDDSILYAASRDGFSNQTFHTKCDGRSPTIVIVQLYDGRVFGGYTSIPWASKGGARRDPEAFLFSLSDGGDRAPCRLQQHHNFEYAVHHHADRGPLFGVGGGGDLGLNLDHDSLHTCRSNCGLTYKVPRKSVKEPTVSDSFLAGKLNDWDVQEVVVYQCKAQRGSEASGD